MAKLICVDNDNHKFGAPDSGVDILERPKRVYVDPLGDTHKVSIWVNNGDNYEINNCLKKDLLKCQNLYELYKKQVNYNVASNHGLDRDLPPRVIIKVENMKVAFEHGHLGTLWPREKGKRYVEKNKPACGRLKYFFAAALHKFRKFKKYKFEGEIKERVTSSLVNTDIDAIIFGHCHTQEYIQDLIFNGQKYIQVFLMPQGRHYFRVHNDDIEFFGSERGWL